MLTRIRTSPIPTWVNVLLGALVLLMAVQVGWNYFDHQTLLDSGISIAGDPDRNVLYTTAGRLVAMIGATLFVLYTQNPAQMQVVLLMSALREGQEMFIDPLFPMADAPMGPAVDFGVHLVIVIAQVTALIVVSRLSRQATATSLEHATAP